MTSGQIGYAEQEDAVRALSRHYTAGRLDVAAFDDRVRRARAATTTGELVALFADLPEPHPDAVRPGAQDTGSTPDAGAGDPAGASTADDDTPTRATPFPSGYPPHGTAHFPAPDDHPAAAPFPDAHPAGAGAPPWSDVHRAQQPYEQDPRYAPYPPRFPSYEQRFGTPGQGPQAYSGHYPPHPGPPAYGPNAGYDAAAPFGREPFSGRPYSDKQKIIAGLLQLFLPFGVGRFYSGHTGLAVAQLVVTFLTFGLGAVWSFVDGIVILAGNPHDPAGRPLRP
ncbi:DUF1707 domain-containing protein [Pseudonocardia nematodicida]|uniref:DUF1707 domain-containing protein n=1 Tax=Pseudonocardia nematodicida TaxID=1206997 RepID=A0ABV1K5E7_9PSEU